MLDVLQSLATLAATVVGIGIAWNGLGTWKRELTGKRDIELCQTVMQKFYEAEEVLSAMRSPMSNSSESADRPKEDGESPEIARRRDSIYVPVARFQRHIEFWLSLLSYKWQMRALFGEKVVTPFNDVDEILREFRTAALMRYDMTRNDEEMDRELRRNFEDTLWGRADDDIAKKMQQSVTAMEDICIPIVRHNTSPSFAERIANRLGIARNNPRAPRDD